MIDLIEIAVRCLVLKEENVKDKILKREEKSDDVIALRVKIHQSVISQRAFKDQNWFRKVRDALKGSIPKSNVIDFLSCWQIIMDEIRSRQDSFFEEECKIISDLFDQLTSSKEPHKEEFGLDSTLPLEEIIDVSSVISTSSTSDNSSQNHEESNEMDESEDTNKDQLIPKVKLVCFCGKNTGKSKDKVICKDCGNVFHKACVGVCIKPRLYTCDSCRIDNNITDTCFCGEPYNRDMIQCDSCDVWYHADCTGKEEKDYRGDTKFLCTYCARLKDYKEGMLNKKQREKTYCTCKGQWNNDMVMCERCRDYFHFLCIGLTAHDIELIDNFFCDSCCKTYGDVITYKNKKGPKKKRVSSILERIGKATTLENVSEDVLSQVNAKIRDLLGDMFSSLSSVYMVDFIFTPNADNRKPWIERLVMNEIFFLQPTEEQTLHQYLKPSLKRETFENNAALSLPTLYLCSSQSDKHPKPDIYLAKMALEQCKMNARYEVDYEEWLERFAAFKQDKKNNQTIQSLFNLQVRAMYMRGFIEFSKPGLVKKIL